MTVRWVMTVRTRAHYTRLPSLSFSRNEMRRIKLRKHSELQIPNIPNEKLSSADEIYCSLLRDTLGALH